MAWGSGNIGGGGSGAWAMVLVNYPSGSTLTATNVSGKKDISATQRLYYVRKPTSGSTQTCVFTITDGTQTKTETISGITIASARTLTMSYRLWLYNRGDECTDVTGGWSVGGNYTSKSTDHILIKTDGYSSTSEAYTNEIVDLTNYSNLYFVYESINVTSSSTYFISGLTKLTTSLPIGNYGTAGQTTPLFDAFIRRDNNTIPSTDSVDISAGFSRKIDAHLQHYSTSLTSSLKLVQVYAE